MLYTRSYYTRYTRYCSAASRPPKQDRTPQPKSRHPAKSRARGARTVETKADRCGARRKLIRRRIFRVVTRH
ncbi:hypothetical protein PI124_g11512 [Phytophthora idaei]|nr:hypothetical protein PI126_g9568 [Phytophthora idaei]KAG3243667.1 hypothetical protein PI124_g11512 [Phytophthora idaei]